MALDPSLQEPLNSTSLQRMRHSIAHVMAEAVQELFPAAKFGIGPAIEDGFYYDFDLPRPLTPEDLPVIEQRMRAIIAGNHPFVYERWPRERALSHFYQQSQDYKIEIIEMLPDEEVGIYQQHNFLDLCRGPHIEQTEQIGAFKLLRVAGAYWRGDEYRPMLQRIYGTAWFSQEELDRYLWRKEEALKRDHRKLGKDLELFHFDVTAPGMPYWLPKGFRLLLELINFWRAEHEKRGYQEISAPLINDGRIWEISGHMEHYKDDMFIIAMPNNVSYGVKPMNCPNAMIVFNLKTRSYRDLPLRLADCDVLHRHEPSGALHGLLRAQKFQQDDAHIFLTEDQLESEYDNILQLADLFYSIFGLTYRLSLGTRPDSFIGDIETWDKAEAILYRLLDNYKGPENYSVAEGDGAFYGPKIDIIMEDAIGRSWQMGSMQLDFQLPRRFSCKYVDRDGQEKHPIVIHRVIYGSLERFIGIYLEHTSGALPVWISPVQARIIPIADRHHTYAQYVLSELKSAGIRAELDTSGDRMNACIRAAQLQKIPYMLIIGDREQQSQSISLRLRSNINLEAMPLSTFLAQSQSIINTKSRLLWPESTNQNLSPLTPSESPTSVDSTG